MAENDHIEPEGGWPYHATKIALKLNVMHTLLRRIYNKEGGNTTDNSGLREFISNIGNRIMTELSDLKTAIDNNKREVSEAIEKHNEVLAQLVADSEAAKTLEELRAGVRTAIADLEGSNKALDDRFKTEAFVPSTQP